MRPGRCEDGGVNSEDDARETGVAPPPLAGDVVVPVATTADFSRREFALREFMDGPTTYAEYKRAALGLESLNDWTMGHEASIAFVEQVVRKTGVTHEPLHVVDVGCGQGDGLRAVMKWAARKSIPLRMTGVDMNPYAARLAKERDRQKHVSAGTIAWVTGDLFRVELARPADVVVSSLLAHHLSDEEIVRLLRWKDTNARVGWMVSDLRRSEKAAAWFGRLGRWLRWDAMLQHDGPVSFRRALSLKEWKAAVKDAGVKAEVRDVGWGRVCVTSLKSVDGKNNPSPSALSSSAQRT